MSTADGAPDVADVAIVGFGPVGATLAGLLARRGRRVVAVDRDLEVYALPRAAHVDHEAMRILQELGDGETLAAGLRPNRGMDFLTADRQVLLSMRSSASTPLGWPASSFIHQPSFDRHLREQVLASGAEVRLGAAVTALDDDGDLVHLRLDDGSEVHARYVVGCDGARSWTRKALGVGLDDLGFEEPWLVVDLLLPDGGVDGLPDIALQVCDPERPHTLVPMPGRRFRFEFMLLPGEDPQAVQDPAVVDRLAAPWMAPGTATLERSAVYTFHGLIARTWRVGRVLLAGDAAHQMPPFLGQGMCSGLRDAANLAWKLDAVLQGHAGAELLDTYQTEREPHVRSIVDAAVGFGRIICTLDAAVAAERNQGMLAARAAHGDAAPSDGTPMPPLAGPLVRDGGGRPTRQPTVGGRRLDDVVGPRWLVAGRTPAVLDGPVRAAWDALDACVMDAVTVPEVAALLDDAGADVVVVRPDRYAYGAAAHLGDLLPPLVGGRA